jgi:hypothetical protein
MITAPACKPSQVGSAVHSTQEDPGDWNRIVQVGLSLVALSAVLWVLFYALWRLVPEATPGSVRVYDAKLAALKKPGVFGTPARSKVLIVGLSYTMTGFKPELFDRLSGGTCASFNLGLPVTIFGRHVYELPELLAMLNASGQSPTEILITWQEPWPPRDAEPKQSVSQWFTPKWDTAAVTYCVFPFRQLARDGSIFLLRSVRHGGPSAFAGACNEEIQSVLQGRGYYFIKSDSLYPNDQLPEDYSLRTDSPRRTMARPVDVWENYIKFFKTAAPGARLILIPNYYRANSCASAPSNAKLRDVLGKYDVEVIGPDYFQYPNHAFSDAAHLNPAGAEIYTQDLWNLLRNHFANTSAACSSTP